MKKTIIMTLCLLMAGILFAQGTLGLTYNLINDGTAYEVRRGGATDTHIEIPETYNSLPVTRIANSSFMSFYPLTSINGKGDSSRIGI